MTYTPLDGQQQRASFIINNLLNYDNLTQKLKDLDEKSVKELETFVEKTHSKLVDKLVEYADSHLSIIDENGLVVTSTRVVNALSDLIKVIAGNTPAKDVSKQDRDLSLELENSFRLLKFAGIIIERDGYMLQIGGETLQLARSIVDSIGIDKTSIPFAEARCVVLENIVSKINKKVDRIAVKINKRIARDENYKIKGDKQLEGECNECSDNIFKVMKFLKTGDRNPADEIVEHFFSELYLELNKCNLYKNYAKIYNNYHLEHDGKPARFIDFVLGCMHGTLSHIRPSNEVEPEIREVNSRSLRSYTFKKAVIRFCKAKGLTDEEIGDFNTIKFHGVIETICEMLHNGEAPFDAFDGKKATPNLIAVALTDKRGTVSLEGNISDDGETYTLDIADNALTPEELFVEREQFAELFQKIKERAEQIKNGTKKRDFATGTKYYDQCMVFLIWKALSYDSEYALELIGNSGWRDKSVFRNALRGCSDETVTAIGTLFNVDMRNYTNAVNSLLPEVKEARTKAKTEQIT